MQIIIHRGSKEIGGSCVEVEASGRRILIDLGLPLDAEINDKKYLPSIPGLDGSDDSLLAILISHPHLDHFGLLAHVSDKIPVIMGKDARSIAEKAASFMKDGFQIQPSDMNLKSGQTIRIGPFMITPYLVDHSAYDAYALLIEADGKRIFYSGDLRMHGRKASLTENLISNPPQNIDVLMLEGSLLGRTENIGRSPSEEEIEQEFASIFRETDGLVMVHASAQNIDRVVSIYKAAIRSGRRLLIDLYTAVVLDATNNRNIPQSYSPLVSLWVPQVQRVQIKNRKWFPLLKKHSKHRIYHGEVKGIANRAVLLFRPVYMKDIERADCIDGAAYIYSQWEGYWERDSSAELRNWIAKHNITKRSIHTSGHASIHDLQRFASAIKPKRIVPIHTFYPEKYANLFKNVEVHEDGESWDV